MFLSTADLVFRSKLAAAVAARGGEVVKDAGACDLAVIEMTIPGALERIRGFVAGGVPVLAYGAHVRADLLRAARDAGATAVPNSEVEQRLGALLSSP